MKKKIAAVTILSIVACFLGCPHTNEITPMPPKITDQDQCAPACANLQKLGCEEGKPIDMKRACSADTDCDSHQTCAAGRCTASCETFCRSTENAGVWLDPVCVSKITSCGQIDSCPMLEKKK
jgi:hypothetical protein